MLSFGGKACTWHRDKNAAINIGRIFLFRLFNDGAVPIPFDRSVDWKLLAACAEHSYHLIIGPKGHRAFVRTLVTPEKSFTVVESQEGTHGASAKETDVDTSPVW